jgi:hypothetical protein
LEVNIGPRADAAQEVKQIKLTDKHIQGFMVAYEDIAKVYDGAESDKPEDPKVEAQAAAVAKKHGFASLADDVSMKSGRSKCRLSDATFRSRSSSGTFLRGTGASFFSFSRLQSCQAAMSPFWHFCEFTLIANPPPGAPVPPILPPRTVICFLTRSNSRLPSPATSIRRPPLS